MLYPEEHLKIYIVTCILFVLALITLIVLVVYQYQKKHFLFLKDIQDLKSTHERNILESQLEIQEQTFESISREIHDNIGQQLSLVKLYLSIIDISNEEKAIQHVDYSNHALGNAISDLRNLSRSLNSEIILNNGLIAAISHEVEQLRRSDIFQVDLSIEGDTEFLETSRELLIFRIVQEALNNIIKHANAHSINISLHYSKTDLQVSIKDDGIGFDSENLKGDTSGLKNIKKRIAILEGTMNVGSQVHFGTIITINIPYSNDTHKT